MGYSLGIGLTNACNLNCAHCYRDTQTINYISLAQVKEICRMIPVDSLGMGTGENALNPEFNAIVSYLYAQGIRTQHCFEWIQPDCNARIHLEDVQ